MKLFQSKSSSGRNWLYKAGLVLGGGFFLYQIINGLRSVIQNNVDLYHPEGILIAFLLAIFITWYQMNLWGLLMNKLGVGIQMKQVYYGYVISFLPRYIPGSFWGYLSRGEWLRKESNIPQGVTALGSAFEVVFLVSGNVGWALSVFFPDSWLKFVLPIVIPFLSLFGLLIARRSTNTRLFRKFFGIEGEKLVNQFSVSAWMVLLISAVIFWGLQGISLTLIILSFTEPTAIKFWPISSLWQITAGYCLAWLIGFIIVIIPSGIGLRELALTKFTTDKLLITSGTASFISVVFRILLALGELFWLLAAIMFSTINKRDDQKKPHK